MKIIPGPIKINKLQSPQARTAVVLLAMLAFLLTCFMFYESTLEDAQITYRYSLRFAEGYPFGYWNKQGPVVQGFTTNLWMLLLAFFGHIAGDNALDAIATSSKLLSILFALFIFSAALISAWTKATRHEIYPISFGLLVSSVLISCTAPFGWYAVNGMETVSFSSLIVLCFALPLIIKNPIVHAVAGVACVLMRPEGILFAFIGLLRLSYPAGNVKTSSFLSRLIKSNLPSLLSAFAFFVVLIFQKLYFGHFMPNTYYAKSGGSGMMHAFWGLVYWMQAFRYYWPVVLGFLVALILIYINRKNIPGPYISMILKILFCLIIYFFAILKSGGDNYAAFPYYRHLLVVLPLLGLVIGVSGFYYYRIRPRMPRLIMSALFLFLTVIQLFVTWPAGAKQSFSTVNSLTESATMFQWIQDKFGQFNPTIATSVAGQLPLYLDSYKHYDYLGLNDEHVAHYGSFDPHSPVDSKTDMAFIIETVKPDIIDGYLSPEIVIGTPTYIGDRAKGGFRGKMIYEMYCNKYLRNNYSIVINAPYKSFNRALLINNDFLADTDNKSIQAESLASLYYCPPSVAYKTLKQDLTAKFAGLFLD
jgi:arabinofuranosyltransferase